MFLAFLVHTPLTHAQSTPDQEEGLTSYKAYHGGEIDQVSLSNGNLNLNIPIVSYPQRGGKLSFGFHLSYNSKSWVRQKVQRTSGDTYYWFLKDLGPQIVFDKVYAMGQQTYTIPVPSQSSSYYVHTAYAVDQDGGNHLFAGDSTPGCTNEIAMDGTGLLCLSPGSVVDSAGTTYTASLASGASIQNAGQLTSANIVDSNGNQITLDGGGWHDTVGRTIAVTSIGSPNQEAGVQWTIPGVAADVSSTTCPAGTSQAVVLHAPSETGTSDYVFCFSDITFTSAFGTASENRSYTRRWLTSIILPNQTSWSFSFDAWGDLKQVTFPLGGSIQYGWSTFWDSNANLTNEGRYVTSRTLSDGTGQNSVWTYGVTTNNLLKVTNPDGSYSTHDGIFDVEQNGSIYDASATLLKTVTKEHGLRQQNPYNAVLPNGLSDINLMPTKVTTTLAGNGSPSVTSSVATGYDAGQTVQFYNQYNDLYASGPAYSPYTVYRGLAKSTKLIDFGGSVLNQTATTYQYEGNQSYQSANLIALPSLTQVLDGAGNVCSQTEFAYDDASHLVSSSVSTAHVNPPNSVRGNLSSTTKRLSPNSCQGVAGGSALISARYTFDTGETQKEVDPLGHWRSYSYAPAYSGAYVTSIANELWNEASFTYDLSSGLRTSSTDANGRTTRYVHDQLGRIKDVQHPMGDTSYDYTDKGAGIGVTVKQSSSAGNIRSASTVDGLGRVIGTQLLSDPQGTVYTRTSYDGMGRVSQVWNPTRCKLPDSSSCGSEKTWGTTTFGYDGLGRKTSSSTSDGNASSWMYTANATTTQDEAGNRRKQVVDAGGRLIEVDELGSTSDPRNLTTTYQYTALGDLLSVNQAGASGEVARNRSFTYDSLSRLITSTNPETGTICYGLWSGSTCANGYDANGNLRAKTDARGLGMSYNYDSLNRLSSTYYFSPNGQNSFPSKQYWYDGQNPAGQSAQAGDNQVGRLSAARSWAPYGNGYHDEAASYDVMGRVTKRTEVSQSESGTSGHSMQVAYDDAGLATTLTYPDGRVVTQSFDLAGRLQTATDANGTTYVSALTYLPNGAPQTASVANGTLSESMTRNSRLQLCDDSIGASGSTSNFLRRQYFFAANPASTDVCNSAPGNNGNLMAVLDGVNTSIRQTYSYDSLNRVQTWTGSSPSGLPHKQNFSYDSFGNLQQANGYPANAQDPLTWPTPTGSSPTANPFTAQNRVDPTWSHCVPLEASGAIGSVPTYDNAGNTLCVGTDQLDAKSFGFNEEEQVVLEWSQQNNNAYTLKALYSYDSSGNRIRSDQYGVPTGTLNWTSNPADHPNWREYTYFGGQMMAEKDQSGAWTDYIFANGKKLAVAPQQEYAIRMTGNMPSTQTGFGYSIPSVFAGYTVRSGDQLIVRQRQSGSIEGGIILVATDGTSNAGAPDQDGQRDDADLDRGPWHLRRIPLDNLAGKTVQRLQFGGGTGLQHNTGPFEVDFAEISLVSQDGTVQTAYSGTNGVALQFVGGLQANASVSQAAADATATHYFVGDQVGTTQMEFSAAGQPLWRGDFAPFGQELSDPTLTVNRYKFTGKERDGESGLDYFGARFYGSTTGRFMSPDWTSKSEAIPYGDLTDPQSLNLYVYADNNPVNRADPDGHCPVCFEIAEEFAQSTAGQQLSAGTAAGWAAAGSALGAAGGYIQSHWESIKTSAESINWTNFPTSTIDGIPMNHYATRTAEDPLPRAPGGRPVPDPEAAGNWHTQLGVKNGRNGPYKQGREFDSSGKPVRDIDHTDHGRPQNHTNPHQHRYNPSNGARGKQEPMHSGGSSEPTGPTNGDQCSQCNLLPHTETNSH